MIFLYSLYNDPVLCDKSLQEQWTTPLIYNSLLKGKIFPWNIFYFYEDILYDKYIHQILFLSQLINNNPFLI